MANAKFHIYADKGGHYRWKLIAPNGQETASSGESFSSHASANFASPARSA